jgi:hypothetical protein
MCDSCVAEYTAGQHVPVTPQMEHVATLIGDWYGYPGCEAGGPLHIVLDDFNVETSFINWCAGEVDGWLANEADGWLEAWSGDHADSHSAIRQGAAELIGGLLPLSEAERAVTIAAGHRLISGVRA